MLVKNLKRSIKMFNIKPMQYKYIYEIVFKKQMLENILLKRKYDLYFYLNLFIACSLGYIDSLKYNGFLAKNYTRSPLSIECS